LIQSPRDDWIGYVESRAAAVVQPLLTDGSGILTGCWFSLQRRGPERRLRLARKLFDGRRPQAFKTQQLLGCAPRVPQQHCWIRQKRPSKGGFGERPPNGEADSPP